MLICSPPGVGKTTLLRDIAYQLSDKYGLRTVVCDPKYELLPEKKPLLCDYICGKDKAAAIECATRCLSPQAIICDELGGEAEARAVLTAQSGGVPHSHGSRRLPGVDAPPSESAPSVRSRGF